MKWIVWCCCFYKIISEHETGHLFPTDDLSLSYHKIGGCGYLTLHILPVRTESNVIKLGIFYKFEREWKKPNPPDAPADQLRYDPAIHAYSLAKGGDKKVGAHFRVREFRCRDGSDPIFIATMLPRILDAIRVQFASVSADIFVFSIVSSFLEKDRKVLVYKEKPRNHCSYGIFTLAEMEGFEPPRAY